MGVDSSHSNIFWVYRWGELPTNKICKKKTDEYDYENIIESFSTIVEHIPFQFIRITKESFIQCPDWHLGAGGKAWVFADEIVVR